MSAPHPESLPAALPAPTPDELTIWWTGIDVDAATLHRAERDVDAATLARARRMRREDDQRRTLLAHALARRVLSAITGRPASGLVLERHCPTCGAGDHGRPTLSGGPSFGLSHGGGLVAVAVGVAEASVAVDVERVQPAERWDAVRRHAFSDVEWAATAGADAARARTQLWSRKEAAVKATGHGLAIELTRVRLDEPAGGVQAVAFAPGEPATPPGAWFVADLALEPRHCAAVAWRATGDHPPRVVSRHAAL